MVEGKNGRVSITGVYDKDGPVLEVGAIQVVPEGQIVLSDEPTAMDDYTKTGRIGLTLEQAEELRNDIDKMISKLEESNNDG